MCDDHWHDERAEEDAAAYHYSPTHHERIYGDAPTLRDVEQDERDF